MSVTLVRTTQPVKPVLQGKDIAVCVLLDSRVMNVKMVRAKFSDAMYCLHFFFQKQHSGISYI